MSLGWIIVLAIVLVILVIGLFSMLNDPKEVDAEEEASVEQEMTDKKKRRWWRR